MNRKVWDSNSGEALHTFQHKHIVRSVALVPQQQPQYLLTVRFAQYFGLAPKKRPMNICMSNTLLICILKGGHEKKIRLFDLGRPDAEPLILGDNPDGFSCDGTIRSLVWDEAQGGTIGVSASEDGLVR